MLDADVGLKRNDGQLRGSKRRRKGKTTPHPVEIKGRDESERVKAHPRYLSVNEINEADPGK
jgi:hypothetical protein